MTHTVTIEESERQTLILAMAMLCQERPGWDDCMASIAGKLADGREMYLKFKEIHQIVDPESATNPRERCYGCGKIANDEQGSPWIHWLNAPLKCCAVVIAGIVKPITCPDCRGSGKRSPKRENDA